MKEGARLALVGAPADFERTLGLLPDGVELRARARGPLDLIVFFTTSRAELERRFEKLAGALAPAGAVWIAWPKKTSGVPTDIREDFIRDVGLPTGLVDNKVCAIDQTWSGLRFVVRLKDRGSER